MIFDWPVTLNSSLISLLLVASQGSGKRVTLTLEYFRLYGGEEVLGQA